MAQRWDETPSEPHTSGFLLTGITRVVCRSVSHLNACGVSRSPSVCGLRHGISCCMQGTNAAVDWGRHLVTIRLSVFYSAACTRSPSQLTKLCWTVMQLAQFNLISDSRHCYQPFCSYMDCDFSHRS